MKKLPQMNDGRIFGIWWRRGSSNSFEKGEKDFFRGAEGAIGQKEVKLGEFRLM